MNMRIGMGMNVSTGQRVSMKCDMRIMVTMNMHCEICGSEVFVSDEGDEIWTCEFQCPSKVRALLENFVASKIVHHNCPECHAHEAVGINVDDYYECRKCNLQYTTCASEGWRRTYLVDEAKMDEGFEAIIPVHVLPEYGNGHFPKDESLRKRLRQVRACERRLLKTLRSMRRWLGSNEVYFDGNGFTPCPDELAKKLLVKHKLF